MEDKTDVSVAATSIISATTALASSSKRKVEETEIDTDATPSDDKQANHDPTSL